MVNDYIPNQRDIIYVNFNSQKEIRPAVVLSNKGFNSFTKLALVCPITSNLKKFPLHIELKNTKKIIGVVMVEQIKTINYISRNAKFVEKLDVETYNEIIDILKSFIDIE